MIDCECKCITLFTTKLKTFTNLLQIPQFGSCPAEVVIVDKMYIFHCGDVITQISILFTILHKTAPKRDLL